MTAIDGTGIHALESLAMRLKESGRPLIICGAQSQPADMIGRSKLVKLVGRQNLQPHLDAALERAAIIHGGFDDPAGPRNGLKYAVFRRCTDCRPSLPASPRLRLG